MQTTARPKPKLIPLILILLFAGALVYMLIGMRGVMEPAEPREVLTLPDRWQSFTRKTFVEGQAAMDEFQRNHKDKIRFDNGARAEYSDGTTDIAVWVVSAPSKANAQQMYEDMLRNIGKAHWAYSEPKPFAIGEAKAHQTEGEGKSNYLYLKGRRVYWVAIRGGEPDALIRQLYPDF